MLKIRSSKEVGKFLKHVPPKHGRQLIAKISSLAHDPCPPDSKELKGFVLPLRRATAGEYRIIYYVEGDTLFVEIVGKRNDDEVYRRLRHLT
jgi:mRNA interferase RelE/StbE